MPACKKLGNVAKEAIFNPMSKDETQSKEESEDDNANSCCWRYPETRWSKSWSSPKPRYNHKQKEPEVSSCQLTTSDQPLTISGKPKTLSPPSTIALYLQLYTHRLRKALLQISARYFKSNKIYHSSININNTHIEILMVTEWVLPLNICETNVSGKPIDALLWLHCGVQISVIKKFAMPSQFSSCESCIGDIVQLQTNYVDGNILYQGLHLPS